MTSVYSFIGIHSFVVIIQSPVMSDSLQPHGLQHTRPPYPLPFSEVCPSSCPLHRWYHPTILSSEASFFCPQSFPTSGIFQWVICLHQIIKYWSFSFSINPSNKCSGLISLKTDWVDLLAVRETFRSLLQHHSLKASILWCPAFFKVQFSQLYMTTGKTIASTIWTFIGRVMSLLFNTLSRFVIA